MAVNILDFAMVIESVHQRSLWKIFRANGILSHLVEIIKSFYDNFTCSVGDGDFLFEVDTDVRNGCVMYTLLFNLVVNWIMRCTTEDQFRSIKWTALLSYIEDNIYKHCLLSTSMYGSETSIIIKLGKFQQSNSVIAETF